MPRTTPKESLQEYQNLITQRDNLRQQLNDAQIAITKTCSDMENLDKSEQERCFRHFDRLFINHSILVNEQNTAVLKIQRLESQYPQIKRDSQDEDRPLRERAKRKS